MANFTATYKAAAQSASVVKLIRAGKVFADLPPDTVVMVWNAGLLQYEAVCDDSTFVDDYWRIEDGSGNIVIAQFPIHTKLLAVASIPDNFLRNDADDQIVGELTVKPAAGTDTQLRIGNETGALIRITAENAAGSAVRGIVIRGGYVALENATGNPIALSNLADGTGTYDSVNIQQLNAVKGAGWAAGMTLKDHEDRLDIIEGSGVFVAATLALTVTPQVGGFYLQWLMNSAPNEAAVQRYEVYRSPNQLAGYTSGDQDSTELSNLRANMIRVSLSGNHDQNIFIHATADQYFVVIAFDHTLATPLCVGGTQTLGSIAPEFAASVPLIAGMASLEAILTLANNVSALRDALGGSAGIKILSVDNSRAAAAAGQTPAVLVEYAETSASEVLKARVTVPKDSVYRSVRVRFNGKTSGTGSIVSLTCSSLGGSQTVNTATYGLYTTTIDLSSLADGNYELTLGEKTTTGTITLTNLTFELLPQ